MMTTSAWFLCAGAVSLACATLALQSEGKGPLMALLLRPAARRHAVVLVSSPVIRMRPGGTNPRSLTVS